MKNNFLIAIDGNEANVQNRVGTGVVTFELLQRFVKKASSKYHVVVYLRSKPLADMPVETEFFRYEIVWGVKMWIKIFLPIYLIFHQKPDVYLAPAHYLPGFWKLRYVTIIHDLAFLYFPEDFLQKDLLTLTSWTLDSVRRSQQLIAVSDSTRQDLLKNYQIAQEKITVVHNGFNTVKSQVKSEPPILAAKGVKKFIVHLGTLQKRKNIPLLLEAFKKLRSIEPNLYLVLAGKKGWIYEEIYQKIDQLMLQDWVILTGYISENDKNYLLDNAQCLVMTSKYEGFGIPILEAFAHGCNVVCSNNSSLPEVAGSGALYASSDSAASFASQIQKLLFDPALAKRLRQNGHKQLQKFSFDAMSADIFDILVKEAQRSK